MIPVKLFGPIAAVAVLSAVLIGPPATAAAFEPLQNIRAAALERARAAAPGDAKLSVGRLDERLRLDACGEPLATEVQSDSGAAMSVEVRCEAAGWKLYVPVSVSVLVPVLVAARPLARGQTLGSADVQVQQRDRGSVGSGWMASLEQAQGRELARAIPAGAVVQPSALIATRLVRRGQSVTLIGRSGGFQVRAQGKALADAAAGEQLRVENLSSRRVVQGQVSADGSVEIGL